MYRRDIILELKHYAMCTKERGTEREREYTAPNIENQSVVASFVIVAVLPQINEYMGNHIVTYYQLFCTSHLLIVCI